MQKQTRHAGETANEGRARCAVAAYWAERFERLAAYDRINTAGAVLALVAFALLVAFKLIGGAA